MSKNKWVVQTFETITTEWEVMAKDELEAREKFYKGEAKLMNEYTQEEDETWGEIISVINKRLH
mgnify:FL=1